MQGWLDNLLVETGFTSLSYDNKLAVAAFNSARYEELAGMPAWQDFVAQLETARRRLIKELLTPGGTLDKWGNSHDEEKRAVLSFVEAVLGHVTSIHAKKDALIAVKQASEDRRAKMAYQSGHIHGVDSIFEGGLQ